MSDWSHVKGTQPNRPDKVLQTDNRVYLRKNITSVNDIAPDETGQEENHTAIPGWEYDEILLSKKQYDDYVKITGNPFYISDTDELKNRILSVETYIAASTEE